MKRVISRRKSELMEQRVIDCEGDQKKLFSLIHSLLGSKKNTVLPEYTSSFTLASTIIKFLYIKLTLLKWNFPFWKRVYPQPTRVQDLLAVNVTSQSQADRVNRNAYRYSDLTLVLFICK